MDQMVFLSTNQLSRSLFQDICHPSSSLYHLLTLYVIHTGMSCLGSEQPRGSHVLSHIPKDIVLLLIMLQIFTRFQPITTSMLNPCFCVVDLFCVLFVVFIVFPRFVKLFGF